MRTRLEKELEKELKKLRHMISSGVCLEEIGILEEEIDMLEEALEEL
jgi:NRPS condensation-like uncharacterized protein